VPEHPDYRRYRDRNRVERMFGKLKQQRHIATRYDKTSLSFESFFKLPTTRLWLMYFFQHGLTPPGPLLVTMPYSGRCARRALINAVR